MCRVPSGLSSLCTVAPAPGAGGRWGQVSADEHRGAVTVAIARVSALASNEWSPLRSHGRFGSRGAGWGHGGAAGGGRGGTAGGRARAVILERFCRPGRLLPQCCPPVSRCPGCTQLPCVNSRPQLGAGGQMRARWRGGGGPGGQGQVGAHGEAAQGGGEPGRTLAPDPLPPPQPGVQCGAQEPPRPPAGRGAV